MNLSEALDAALPEIPQARLARAHPPCLDPQLIIREDVVDGEPIVAAIQREKGTFFRFPLYQWNLAILFDGTRTYEDIAAIYSEQTGAPTSVDDVHAFADALEESDFWYKTPQERNLALSQKLMAQRGRRAKRKSKFNLVHISFSAWDPDRYLGWLDSAIGKFVYSRWCVMAVVLLFMFEATVFVSQWHVIAPDAVMYYNFTKKGLVDLAQFWTLMLFIGFIHESAHGLTCKHYGGEVHGMGLLLIYLMPAFFCDVTEAWVTADRKQRLATIIAGIWIEMVVCGLGMIVWLNTSPGNWLHNLAYQLILITGLAVIVINLNPLIKLDGYFFLTELIGVADLKERSTSFLSGWFQTRVLGLPTETPVVPRRRILLFVLYAFVSGLYSYMILFLMIRFAYNVTSKFMAELAVIPAGALAFVVFRSRLRSLWGVLKRLWTEKFSGGRALRPRTIAGAVVLAVVLFVPLLRDREDAYYVVEPLHTDTLHSAAPGRVNDVLVREGQAVRAGQALLTMTSAVAESMTEEAVAQAHDASFQAFNAELQGQSIGAAAAEQNAALGSNQLASEARSSLVVTAPEDAIVVTRDPGALLGQSVGSGQALLELADDGPRAVRVYIPTAALERIRPGAEVALSLPGRFSMVHLTLAQPGGDAVNLPEGLVESQNYKGVKLPVFYCARMVLPASAGSPLFGVAGQAKIFGARHSLAERIVTVVMNLVRAHVW
jgi:putative peptide zinc metalloprotease protein